MRWNKLLSGCLPLLILINSAFAQQAINSLPKSHHKFIVIAHRGNHIDVPENTLAAYEEAIRVGADYVEVDLHTTKDGHLVILHNGTVDKMTGEKGAVSDLTYEEIKKLRIHPVKNTDTGVYRIPDFASVLKLCKDHINIYLDFKDADVAETYRLIKQAGMEHQIVVYLNKKEQYGQWRKAAPHIPLMASLRENESLEQWEKLLEKKPINIVDNAYNATKVKFLHQRGITVWLDVESKDEGPAQWNKTIKMGTDGLQTDHPERLIAYLKMKRLR